MFESTVFETYLTELSPMFYYLKKRPLRNPLSAGFFVSGLDACSPTPGSFTG